MKFEWRLSGVTFVCLLGYWAWRFHRVGAGFGLILIFLLICVTYAWIADAFPYQLKWVSFADIRAVRNFSMTLGNLLAEDAVERQRSAGFLNPADYSREEDQTEGEPRDLLTRELMLYSDGKNVFLIDPQGMVPLLRGSMAWSGGNRLARRVKQVASRHVKIRTRCLWWSLLATTASVMLLVWTAARKHDVDYGLLALALVVYGPIYQFAPYGLGLGRSQAIPYERSNDHIYAAAHSDFEAAKFPIVLHPNRFKILLATAFFISGATVGIWLTHDPDMATVWKGYLLIGLCVVMAFYIAVQVVPEGSSLRLDESGFTIRHYFRTRTFQWTDIDSFFVVYGRTQTVSWNLVPTGTSGEQMRTKGALPRTYGKKAKELSNLMNNCLLRSKITA